MSKEIQITFRMKIKAEGRDEALRRSGEILRLVMLNLPDVEVEVDNLKVFQEIK